MANHGWVKTRKKMKPEQISAMLNELNESLFKGNLEIDYHLSTLTEPGWGEHTWELTYKSENKEWMHRVCWLETSRHFEMRHGGGSYFAWWIDTLILNEVAVRFNGTIYDDGGGEKTKGVPNKFNCLKEFMNSMLPYVKDENVKKQLMKFEYELVPPEFKKKIKK